MLSPSAWSLSYPSCPSLLVVSTSLLLLVRFNWNTSRSNKCAPVWRCTCACGWMEVLCGKQCNKPRPSYKVVEKRISSRRSVYDAWIFVDRYLVPASFRRCTWLSSHSVQALSHRLGGWRVIHSSSASLYNPPKLNLKETSELNAGSKVNWQLEIYLVQSTTRFVSRWRTAPRLFQLLL